MPVPRSYQDTPDPVTGYTIDADFRLVVPPTADITNLVSNPSLEANATGYTAVGGSVARSLAKQRYGAYSLAVTPTAAVSDGFFYGTISAVALGIYPWSFAFWGEGGVPYKAYWATTAGVQVGGAIQFRGKRRWERLVVPYIESSSTTRRLYITKDNSPSTAVFYVDGMLVPTPATDQYVWRYFDGDTVGFVPNQVDFYWTGTPHGSTSIMRANTRAGGKIVPLLDYGFVLLAMMGLGLSTPNNIAIPLALPGGAQYQRTLSPAAAFDLVGYLQGVSQADLNRKHSDLSNVLDVRRQGKTQPLLLQYTPVNDCNDAIGETAEIVCSPAGGMEGVRDNNHQENLDLKFQNYLPVIAKLSGTEGAAVNTRVSFTAGYVARRDASGIWGALQTSGLNGQVNVSIPLPDGRWLLGGAFTDAGGDTNADKLAIYDPVTNVFSAATTAGLLNNVVRTLCLLSDGTVAVGGDFTVTGGFAQYLRRLNLTTGTWSNFSASTTDPTGPVWSVVQLPDTNLAIGGNFLNWAGIADADYLVKLNLAAATFAAFNATPLGATVQTLALSLGGSLYIGGQFINAGGFANDDFLTIILYPTVSGVFANLIGFTPLSTTVAVIRPMSDGSMQIGGSFVDVNGDTTWDYLITSFLGPPGGLAGPAPLIFVKPFSSISSVVSSLTETTPGTRLVGGSFSSVNGVPLYDGIFQYQGTTLVPLDVDFPGATPVNSMGSRPTAELVVGLVNTGTAYTSGTTTLTNSGSAPTQPVIVLSYAAAATVNATLYSIRNLTTGQIISFNIALLPGETIVIDLANGTITSNVRGNVLWGVAPGGSFTTFALLPGDNRFNIFIDIAAAANVTSYAYWTPLYASIYDLNE